MIVDYTDKARKLFNNFEDQCEKKSESTDLNSSMWVRTPEHARKIALIMAFSAGKDKIDVEATESAVEVTQHLNQRAIKDIEENLADNLNEKLSKRIEGIIRDHKDGIVNWELTRKTRFLNQKQRTDILNDLIESNIIVAVEESSSRGMPKIKWFAKA